MLESLFTVLFALFSVFYGGLESTPDVPAPTAPAATSQTAEVVYVTDGDTITVRLDGQTEKVRYIGIDTPEPYRDGEPVCYALEASEANRQLVEGKTVRLESDTENTDRYGRLLRYVYVDDVLVNGELLRGGFATTLTIAPNTAHANEFKTLEAEAKREGVGLWSFCR